MTNETKIGLFQNQEVRMNWDEKWESAIFQWWILL